MMRANHSLALSGNNLIIFGGNYLKKAFNDVSTFEVGLSFLSSPLPFFSSLFLKKFPFLFFSSSITTSSPILSDPLSLFTHTLSLHHSGVSVQYASHHRHPSLSSLVTHRTRNRRSHVRIWRDRREEVLQRHVHTQHEDVGVGESGDEEQHRASCRLCIVCGWRTHLRLLWRRGQWVPS